MISTKEISGKLDFIEIKNFYFEKVTGEHEKEKEEEEEMFEDTQLIRDPYPKKSSDNQ